MCDVGTVLAVAAVGSAVIGGVSQVMAGNAAADASKYNAQVATMNANISERRAKDALMRGAAAEQQKRYEVAQIQGRQLAASAANGVDVGFGSPLDTIMDTATMGELDALTIRRNAANENYDYRVQAANGKADAVLSNMNANSSLLEGYMSGASTILGGVGKAYGGYQSSRPTAVGAIH